MKLRPSSTELRRRPDRRRHRPLAEPRAARARGRRARPALRLPAASTSTSSGSPPRTSASWSRGARRSASTASTSPIRASSWWSSTSTSSRPTPRRSGAVNTVVFDDGRAIGHNTDVAGLPGELPRAGCRTRATRPWSLLSARAARAPRSRTRRSSLGAQRLAVVDADRGARRRAGRGARVPVRPRGAVDAPIALGRAARRGRRRHQRDAGRHGRPTPGMPFPPEPAATRAVGRRRRLPAARDRAAARRPAPLGCRTLDGGGMAVFQAARVLRAVHRRASPTASACCATSRRWSTSAEVARAMSGDRHRAA